MDPTPTKGVTQLLEAWRAGSATAYDQVFELVYPELRRIAARFAQHERTGHTIQSTALVHEAYLRMAGPCENDWHNRAHFFAVAAHVMRGILVDYARARNTAKRGPGMLTVTFTEASAHDKSEPVSLIDLESALQLLETLDPQQSRIVEMRYFGGMSIEETAAVLKISVSTVKRGWVVAKTWLRRQLAADATSRSGGRLTGWMPSAGCK